MKSLNGLFDLSILESAGNDDVLNLNLNEGTDVNVPVPGGLNEKAPGQPADQTIPVPSKTTITADSYNEAITNLKKTFKEAVDILDILEHTKVVDKSTDDLQREFTEDAMADAIFESFANGPFFEAVAKENKSEIKSIAKKIRKTLCKVKRNINWYTGKNTSGAKLGLLDPAIISSRNKKMELRAWQLVCIVYPQKKVPLGKCIADLNEEFSDVLGSYKLKMVKMNVYNTGKVKELTEEDKKNTKRWKLYILIIDNDSSAEPAFDVELDDSAMKKLNTIIAPTKNMNEFVEFLEACSKECDDGECDGEECKKDKGKKDN